jgi:preprotein translocase subunit SecA
LDAVDDLREGIGLRGYGQMDPLVEYKNEAFSMFESLINQIDYEITHRIFKAQVQLSPQQQQQIQQNQQQVLDALKTSPSSSKLDDLKKAAVTPKPQSVQPSGNKTDLLSSLIKKDSRLVQAANNQIQQRSISNLTLKKQKIGRNDPCPCGSGKKYKKCHYPQYG